MEMEADRLIRTQGLGLAILRVVAGIVFLAHGGQKLLLVGPGNFGSQALAGLGVPLPVFMGYMVTLVELIGGILLIVGLFTRLVAILLAVDMLVATLMVHLPNGFFMANNGFEFTLLLLAAAVALAVSGPGEASLDKILASRTNNPTLARLTR
jgi:putative oxidoreductase